MPKNKSMFIINSITPTSSSYSITTTKNKKIPPTWSWNLLKMAVSTIKLNLAMATYPRIKSKDISDKSAKLSSICIP